MRLPVYYGSVNEIVRSACRRHGVTLHRYANVGNHLHLCLKIPSTAGWAGFIRELTGRVALRTGISWLHRPFTRLVQGWGQALQRVLAYIYLNELEGDGVIRRHQRDKLRELRREYG